ncbi:MAG TPA: DUF1553 domain-containing protein, partial [Bryobacteraceae bacterium]|nr:DUF1553 domain-containing protein [Bryobacteraceae bacterium]
MHVRLSLSIALSLCCSAQTPEFNRDVRPILSDKCFACHGPGAAGGKTVLRLDSPSRAVIPGNADNSPLYQRITTDSKAKRMPPSWAGHDKLSSAETDTIRRWIEAGAKWEQHWSFIPPRRPQGTIDSIVAGRLQKEGLKPSARADKRTLLRRVTLDLTGLPPTVREMDAFVVDTSPGAYERAVDRLLASPAYSERMATRWMEAARYSDTNGYQTDGVREMWRWRDWVIDAFARNMPWDQFTVDQIAGDLLPNATLSQKVATGFHRNHRTTAEGGIIPEEYRTEYVADRAETTATVWMGLTAGCARCHDHKYDPISQKDFYRLFAFFNNVPEKGLVYNFGNDEPMIKAPTPEQERKLASLDGTVAEAETHWKTLQPSIRKALQTWAAPPEWTITDGLQYRWDDSRHFNGSEVVEADKGIANFDYLQPFTFSAKVRPEKPTGSILSHDEDHAEGSGHGLHLIDGKLRLHVVFRWTDIGMRLETEQPLPMDRWSHVAVTYDGSRYAAGVRMYVNGQPQKLKVLFDDLNWPMNFKVPFRIGGGAGLRFAGDIADVRVYSRALPEEEAQVIAGTNETHRARLCWLATAAPKSVRSAEAKRIAARTARDKFYRSLPSVMVMSDAAPRQTHVLKRGAYDAPGESVSAGVPSFLPQLPEGMTANRLTLARWLVSRDNPLTARVTVNRFWQMLFGVGLVKTTEDFGSQGEWPVYPELLDLLAVEFMDSGWNVRHILKTIVTSETYQQSSAVTPELLARDPENRLLTRGPRLRLTPDAIRDSALAVSGLLVQKIGGPSVKPPQPPGLWQELAGGTGYVADAGEGRYRRSLYTYWRRTIPPPYMVNFDASNREVCSVRDTRTNTPLQALNLMNDPSFLE